MTSEGIATRTLIALPARVYLRVPLQIVSAHESLHAVVTAKLSVAEMGLDVRLNVFLATESLVTIFKSTDVLVVHGVRSFDVLCYLVQRDVGFFNRSVDTGF